MRESISKYPVLTPRNLTLIFLAALLALAVVRFDMESLVRGWLAEVAVETGLKLDFDQMSVHGLSADFGHVSLSAQRLPEVLIFEQVEVSPLWTSLLSGGAGADLMLMWQGNMFAATLVEADQAVLVETLQVRGEMSKLSRLVFPLMQVPFPISASGSVEAKGKARFDRISGTPESGQLHATWRGAKAGAMGAEFALGDLVMSLQGEAGQWQWQLNDDGVGMIKASGSVEQLPTLVEMWPVHGSVVIDTTKINDPYLIAWLPDMGGKTEIRLKLSGTLSRPRLDRIK